MWVCSFVRVGVAVKEVEYGCFWVFSIGLFADPVSWFNAYQSRNRTFFLLYLLADHVFWSSFCHFKTLPLWAWKICKGFVKVALFPSTYILFFQYGFGNMGMKKIANFLCGICGFSWKWLCWRFYWAFVITGQLGVVVVNRYWVYRNLQTGELNVVWSSAQPT